MKRLIIKSLFPIAHFVMIAYYVFLERFVLITNGQPMLIYIHICSF